MKIGDLVWVDFGYGKEELAVVLQIEKTSESDEYDRMAQVLCDDSPEWVLLENLEAVNG